MRVLLFPLLSLLLAAALPQQATAQINPNTPNTAAPKPKPVASKAWVTVRADAPAVVYINFDSVGVLQAGAGRKFSCPTGDALVEVVDLATRLKVTREFKLAANENKLLDAQLKDMAAEQQRENVAAAEAEQQRQAERKAAETEQKNTRKASLVALFKQHMAHGNHGGARTALKDLDKEFPGTSHRCEQCSGQGTTAYQEACSGCDGNGCAVCSTCAGHGRLRCGACNGSGQWNNGYQWLNCGQCSGTGAVRCSCRCIRAGEGGSVWRELGTRMDKAATGQDMGRVSCGTCKGAGSFLRSRTCTACKGIGKVVY